MADQAARDVIHPSGDAIARHLWMIGLYLRGMTDDPARQAAMARNMAEAVHVIVAYQRAQNVDPIR